MYIGEEEYGCKSPAVNSRCIWNVHERVRHDLPRTTNAIESWHRTFNSLFPHPRPGMAHFIDKLKLIEDEVHIVNIQLKCGKLNLGVRKDYKKEYYKEKIVCNYYEFVDDSFFVAFDSFYDWKLDCSKVFLNTFVLFHIHYKINSLLFLPDFLFFQNFCEFPHLERRKFYEP